MIKISVKINKTYIIGVGLCFAKKYFLSFECVTCCFLHFDTVSNYSNLVFGKTERKWVWMSLLYEWVVKESRASDPPRMIWIPDVSRARSWSSDHVTRAHTHHITEALLQFTVDDKLFVVLWFTKWTRIRAQWYSSVLEVNLKVVSLL